ncbi:hypothetical protein OB2597_05170 [Pseudooceanicola batsensis HTCC2597]|uniref:Uncharacterized protein n=1 Tax=Pseudooceanicola batsensis (strain ATCC BAA-863 / DSM 15984 / KCTC 12145 / HTCC2597) TaxID=252305 RepID=A3TSL9_PSEBH|nr:hypothetical protein [Pseudooceanicola batsensis]EAQ04646.1 hypothetical protein OB2597_05170 [Pseudooceanicola batsensis HTCC2597]
MNDNSKSMRATLRAAEQRGEFVAWLRADFNRLVAAADLLGGEPWTRRAGVVAEAMASGASPEVVEEELIELHRLLTLEFADDIESDEAARFAAVHPDDPIADDARVCAEALERGLQALRAFPALAVKEAA